jgi:hypothetical protein
MGDKHWFQLLIIMIFSCAIVLMGANELHQRFVQKYQGKISPEAAQSAQQLIQQLKGREELTRASLAYHAKVHEQTAVESGNMPKGPSEVEQKVNNAGSATGGKLRTLFDKLVP